MDNHGRWFEALEVYAQNGHLNPFVCFMPSLTRCVCVCVWVCLCVFAQPEYFPKASRRLAASLPASQAIKCTPWSISHPELSLYASSQEHADIRPAAFQGGVSFSPQTVKNRPSCSYSGCPSATLCLFVILSEVNWDSNLEKGFIIIKSWEGSNIEFK